jgi:hypothetical protein
MSENPNNLVKQILLAAPKYGARLFRRNTGVAWTGNKITKNADGSITIHDPRPFQAGVKGQSDAYGWVTVTVTPDMVGERVAVHVEAEAKTGSGRLTPEQSSWLDTVQKAGGRAGVVRGPGDLRTILG